MTFFQKVAEAINNFKAIELTENEKFFIDPVMNQLIIIHDLMIFPYIENEKFQQYIGWFRNDIRMDINRCLNVSSLATHREKLDLLNSIKGHISPKLKVVEFAFTYYLDNRELLNKEWGAEVRRIKKEGILQAFRWQSIGFKK
jgi:hypothetical protein